MQVGNRGRSRAYRRTFRWGAPGGRRTARLEALPARGGAARPNRYRIQEGGRTRVLRCSEAPTLEVRVEAGFSVTAATARSYAPGSIFLDGAAQGEPFLDPERAVYNLDHHEGCIRAFTLATCEQAMVLVRKRLDLRKRDWTVYANDADLDTVLAIWVLLNHLRLCSEGSRARAEIMPLLRLEGSIDAHGLELHDLCALPPELLSKTRDRMNQLRARELELKRRGHWDRIDLLDYVATLLGAIDRMVYTREELEEVEYIEELARAEISTGSVAVVCRADSGIYEVERQLRRFHGDRLGLIALQKDPSTYSLRQVDPGLPATLDKVYARLNLVDPASSGSRSANRWGGSEEIGGSPRSAGTRMSPSQIASVCRDVHRKPSLGDRMERVGRAALLSGAFMLCALVGTRVPGLLGQLHPGLEGLRLDPHLSFAAGLFALAGLALIWVGSRAPGLYGLRSPAGFDWWPLVPLALAGAVAGGVWLPDGAAPRNGTDGTAILSLLALPAAGELLFRGLLHGSLASRFPIQTSGGPWSLSAPALISSALYAAWIAVPLLAPLGLGQPLGAASPALPILGAFGFGVAAAMARERSESVLAPIVIHWLGVATLLAARLLVG